jgi:predicted DCC family thiol-disulfide oxidoreductase YuxK
MKKIFKNIREVFALDLRSLALARVLFAMTMLYDFITRIPYIEDFYTDNGLLTRENFVKIMDHGYNWSIFLFSGELGPISMLYGVMLVLIFFLMIGFKHRFTTITLWIFMASIQNRNWMINNSGDDLYRLMLVIFIFIPINEYYSVDHALRKNKLKRITSYSSLWTLVYIVQISLMYITSYFYKTGADWHITYDALYKAFSLGIYTRDSATYLLAYPKLLKAMTFLSMLMEGFLPYFLLLGLFNNLKHFARYFVIGIFVGFHVSLILTFKIGAFPWICLSIWPGLLPAHFWDVLLKTKNIFPQTKVYYDGDCSFCKKMVLILKELLILKNTNVLIAQSNLLIEQEMNKHNSWVVEINGVSFFHYEAMCELIRSNSSFRSFHYLFSNPLARSIGYLAYKLVSNNRSLFSKFTSILRFNNTKAINSTAKVSMFLAVTYLVLALAWNFSSLGLKFPLRRELTTLVNYTNLYQNWGLFAPNVRSDEGFFVADGELINGDKYDIYNDLPFISATAPSCLSCAFPSKEWRKFFMNLIKKKAYQSFYGQYICRKWNVLKRRPIRMNLKKFELHYIMRVNKGSKDGYGPWKRHFVWRHFCYQHDLDAYEKNKKEKSK